MGNVFSVEWVKDGFALFVYDYELCSAYGFETRAEAEAFLEERIEHYLDQLRRVER